MSLRLLPAFAMDNDDDDDGNFTKWMSSYWGHGVEGGASRDRKRSFRSSPRSRGDRRASLPTVSQLDAMKLNRLHAVSMATARPREAELRPHQPEPRPHQRARRASSDEIHRSKTSAPETRISTIPELTESLERRLNLRDRSSQAPSEEDRLCLICHEDVRTRGGGAGGGAGGGGAGGAGGVQELHCSHRFHKEAARRLDLQPRAPPGDARRKSADGPITAEKQHALRRQLSLRRHR